MTIDHGFNAAVIALASQQLPGGYITTSAQTQDYESMKAEFVATGILAVNTGFSENTIFGSPEINWAFRAWHDSCHLAGDFPFTEDGEYRASQLQIQQLRAMFADDPSIDFWCDLVDIEVNGQVRFYLENQDFPSDQVAFTLDELRKRGYNR